MKTKKKIEAIAITAVAFIAIFALIGTASATATNLSITDGNDETLFYGENITLTWDSPNPKTVLWINSTGASFGVDADDNTPMYDDKNARFLRGYEVPGSGSGPFTYSYTFANYTVNESAQGWIVYINDAASPAEPGSCTNQTLIMNSYNVSLQAGRSVAGGNSVLAGDTIKIFVNTSGMLAKGERDDLDFTITLPEGGNTVDSANNIATTGNYTFNITTAKAGVGVFKNITLNYGGFSWNSTQLVTYSGWGSAANTQFNVSQVNLKAYDLPYITDPEVSRNITSVNITTLDHSGNLISANPAYPVNVTLTNSAGTSIAFNDTYPALIGNVYTANVTFAAGDGETTMAGLGVIAFANHSYPLNTTGSITSVGTYTITAKVNTSGTEWTDTYIVHPSTESVTLERPADTSYQIGEYVLITGWNATATGTTWVNITGPGGTSVLLTNSTAATNSPTDGGFTHNWSTNWTWNTEQISTSNATLNKTGTYTITAGNQTSGPWYDSYTITLNEDITVAPNATSMPVNSSLWINGTTDRWNSNGTSINCTISTASNKGGTIINNETLNTTITTFNSTTGLANYSILWDSSINLSEIEATSPIPWDTFSKAYYITVNDSAAKDTTATITITDSISVNPATGVAGRNFTARGESTRENGTNISVQIRTAGGIPIRTNYTTVSGGEWNITMNASTAMGEPLTTITTYKLIANDSIVKAENTLTLGSGEITLEVTPAETTMDGVVWLNGTTDLTNGTYIWFNITNSTGIPVNRTGANAPCAIVSALQTFNTTWEINSSLIAGKVTAPLTTLTVKAYNDTIYTTKTLTVNETLTITTPDVEIATGGDFKVEGTLNRVDGTTLQIVTTDTGGNPTNQTTATVYGGEFNLTLLARYDIGGSGDLPAGDYIITAKDSPTPTSAIINASATINMAVVFPTVTLVEPTDGATYSVNESVPISGTTNIGNETIMTVTIARSSGPTGWTGFSNTSITCTSDLAGDWNGMWNMTADAAFQALTTKTGDYHVYAYNASGATITHTITLTEPTALAITATPASVVVDTATDVLFTVTSDGTAVEAATVTLTGTPLAESLSGTTAADGTVTIAVNATTNGTITATASKTGYTSDTTTITASVTGLTGDVNDDGKVNVLDMIRIGQHFGETGTAGWIPEDVKADGVIDVLDMILIGQNWTG